MIDLSRANCPTTDLRITVSKTTDAHSFVTWLDTHNLGESNILLSATLAEAIADTFPINSKIVSLIEEQALDIRVASTLDLPTAIVSEKQQLFGAEFGDFRQVVKVEDDDFRRGFEAEFDTHFEESTPLDIDIPAWSELLDQLGDIVGPPTRDEYVRLIDAAVENDIEAIDEVSVALIATAIGGGLLYDLGKWGEETNIASKATFSRRKTALEEDGVLTSEKVPVDVGRPRLRLRLGDRVGGLSRDIGVGSREIDGSEPIDGDDAGADADRSSTATAPEDVDGPTDTPDRSDRFITQLDEELRELLSAKTSS